MTSYISVNGEFFPAHQPVLHSHNRSFRYGDGFFETMRVSGGKLLWFRRHYQRVITSAGLLGMQLPHEFSPEYFFEKIMSLYRKNHPGNSPARIRMAFFRSPGGHYSPAASNASFLIESVGLENELFKLNHKGLMVDIYPEMSKNTDFLSGVKSSSALIYVMAGIFCSASKLDDCIILNNEGNVAEALSSNLFVVKDNELITPAPDQGCVHGIMRTVVLDIASQLKLKAREVILTTADVEDADECFLTNTINGIKWVGGLRRKRFFNRMAPAIISELNQKAVDENF